MGKTDPMHRRKSDRQALRFQPRTLLEMLGKNRIVMEYHKGICSYGPEEICVRTSYGHIRILGRELNLCCMRREQLCIIGTIESLELMGGDDLGPVG